MHVHSIRNLHFFLFSYLTEISEINILLKFCDTKEPVIPPQRLIFNVPGNVLLRRDGKKLMLINYLSLCVIAMNNSKTESSISYAIS